MNEPIVPSSEAFRKSHDDRLIGPSLPDAYQAKVAVTIKT